MALNFSLNPGWGYLPPPSLEILAKSHMQIFGYEPKQDLSTMAVMKTCDCAKSYHLALNFSLNPGWGYLSPPSLKILAKSHAQILFGLQFFAESPSKTGFKYNGDNENVIVQNPTVWPSIFC